MSVVEIAGWVIAVVVLVVVGATFVRSALGVERRAQLRMRARRRSKSAELAAVEASLDDAAFSPETIRASVKTIVTLGAAACDGAEPSELRSRPDAGLIRAWGASVRERYGEFVEIHRDPAVHVLRVVNRERRHEDRVIARVRVTLARDPDRSRNMPGDRTLLAARTVHVEERWTLGRGRHDWLLVSLSGDPLSSAVMAAPQITSPADDDERLREASLRELGATGAARGADAGELTDRDAPPARQLQDLSVVDDRFEPALLEATIKHILDAWELSADGSTRTFAELATKNAIRSLHYPGGPGGHRYVRDVSLSHWEVAGLNPAPERPTVQVAIEIKAATSRSDGKRLSGSDRRRRRLHLLWTLKLEADDAGEPRWRLAASENR
ncbi:MAG TPA: hypothetical protein VGF93_06355 [Solirubrobacteraceae bacterium]